MTYAVSSCDFQSYKKVFNYWLEVEDFCNVSYQRVGIVTIKLGEKKL